MTEQEILTLMKECEAAKPTRLEVIYNRQADLLTNKLVKCFKIRRARIRKRKVYILKSFLAFTLRMIIKEIGKRIKSYDSLQGKIHKMYSRDKKIL